MLLTAVSLPNHVTLSYCINKAFMAREEAMSGKNILAKVRISRAKSRSSGLNLKGGDEKEYAQSAAGPPYSRPGHLGMRTYRFELKLRTDYKIRKLNI